MHQFRALLFSVAFLLTTAYSSSFAATLNGVGATIPYPLYAKWAEIYKKETDIAINYQPIGSSSGIKQIIAKTVDFAATDIPLTPDQLQKMQLIQFPTVIGGIVPIVNIKGIPLGQLKLTGPILADIYLGNIQQWNDPRIQHINPHLTLPNQNITTVHRADGSGTTFVFTHYLTKVSPSWQRRVGFAAAIQWPNGIGGKGNEGIAQYVSRIPGSIGYVEYAYAKHAKTNPTQLQNKAGVYLSPTPESFSATAQYAKWQPRQGFGEILTDQVGKNSWPITAATFILVPREPSDLAKTKTILKFFAWAYQHGKEEAVALDYIPLPLDVISSIKSVWTRAFPFLQKTDFHQKTNTSPRK